MGRVASRLCVTAARGGRDVSKEGFPSIDRRGQTTRGARVTHEQLAKVCANVCASM